MRGTRPVARRAPLRENAKEEDGLESRAKILAASTRRLVWDARARQEPAYTGDDERVGAAAVRVPWRWIGALDPCAAIISRKAAIGEPALPKREARVASRCR